MLAPSGRDSTVWPALTSSIAQDEIAPVQKVWPSRRSHRLGRGRESRGRASPRAARAGKRREDQVEGVRIDDPARIARHLVMEVSKRIASARADRETARSEARDIRKDSKRKRL
jgi:hypothetical protein